MKILIFGRGVISTQYAWALEKAGHSITFYVRAGKTRELGTTVNMNVYDARKKTKGQLISDKWNIHMIEHLPADHEFDIILVSVQHYHLSTVISFLADKMGKSTLLIFNNIWGEPDQIIDQLSMKQVVFGFPRAGGGFDSAGVLNGTFTKSIVLGNSPYAQKESKDKVIGLFKSAGFTVKLVDDFRTWLLGHFVLNAAMHLESLKGAQDNKNLIQLLQTSAYWKAVKANAKELLPLLRARKVEVSSSPDLKLVKLPSWLLSFASKIFISKFPSVAMILGAHNNVQELKSYSRDVADSAKALNISLPRFSAAEKLYND